MTKLTVVFRSYVAEVPKFYLFLTLACRCYGDQGTAGIFRASYTIRFILHTVVHTQPLSSHYGNTKTHWKVGETRDLICKNWRIWS
jgi:hypothetical protein